MSVDISSDDGETVVQGPTRRDYLKRLGVASGTVVTLGAAGEQVAPRYSPVGRTQAIGIHGMDASAAASRAMWDGITSFFSSGIDPDEAAEQEATNLHWEIYDSADSVHRQIDGFLTELENFTQPSDPTSGPLEAMVWSEIRAEAFKGIEEGKSQADTVSDARDAAQEYVATRETNVLRQWNEVVADWIRWVFMFDNNWDESEETQATDWDDDVSDYELGTDGINWLLSWEHQSEELVANDWIDGHNGGAFNKNDSDAVQVREHELADGQIQEYYNFHFYITNANGSWTVNANPISADSESSRFLIVSPDGDEISYFEVAEDFGAIMDAIEAVREDMSGDIGDYVEEVYSAHQAGDIESFDILSGTELASEFSDSEGFDRVASEMLALGLAPPESGSQVTIEYDGNERTGHLFVDYSFDYVPEYAYEFDSDSSEIRIDADYFMPDAAWFVNLEDAENTYEYGAESDEFDEDGDGYVLSIDESTIENVDPDGTDYGVESITNEARGELRAFVPEGETITAEMHSHTIIAHENSDGEVSRTSISGDEEFTLIEAENGEDRLVLSSFNQQTRDPALALDQAEAQSQNRETVRDLEEQGIGLPGFGDAGDWLGFGDVGWLTDNIAGIPVWGWVVGVAGALSVTGDS